LAVQGGYVIARRDVILVVLRKPKYNERYVFIFK
jgi:hypothetical protein